MFLYYVCIEVFCNDYDYYYFEELKNANVKRLVFVYSINSLRANFEIFWSVSRSVNDFKNLGGRLIGT